MSRFVKVGISALAVVGLSATVASAADLDPPAPVIDHTPIAVGGAGGFYLRGDIGYTVWNDPDLSDTVGGGTSNYFGEMIDNSLMAGVGVGYKFKKFVRTDVTFDIRKGADLKGFSPCGTCIPPANPFTTETVELSAYTVMANLYFDLGEYGGFTPYIGGGVGGAYLDFGKYVSTGNPPPQAPTDVFSGDDGFRFAWSIAAGTSYAVNENLSFDFGYRYLNINDGRVSDIVLGGTDFGDVDYENLDAHEFRVGFRYMFGGGNDFSGQEPIFK